MFSKENSSKKQSLRSILSDDLLEQYKDIVDLEEKFSQKMEERWLQLGKTPEEFEKSLDDPKKSIEEREELRAQINTAEMKIMKSVKKKVAEEKALNNESGKKNKKISRGDKQKWIPVR